jgi:hypothetical protein
VRNEGRGMEKALSRDSLESPFSQAKRSLAVMLEEFRLYQSYGTTKHLVGWEVTHPFPLPLSLRAIETFRLNYSSEGERRGNLYICLKIS